jgi:plastocyanin
MIHRRTFAALLAGLSASATHASANGKTVDVTMKQSPKSRFDHDVVKIADGDTVKWTNPVFVIHGVTFDRSMRRCNSLSMPLVQNIRQATGVRYHG